MTSKLFFMLRGAYPLVNLNTKNIHTIKIACRWDYDGKQARMSLWTESLIYDCSLNLLEQIWPHAVQLKPASVNIHLCISVMQVSREKADAGEDVCQRKYLSSPEEGEEG